MTDVHDMMNEIESTENFTEWEKKHSEHFLVHVFCLVREGKGESEVGYYSKDTDKITVFEHATGVMRPPEDVFKDGGTLLPLEIEKVKIGLDNAREIAETYRSEKYEQHPVQQEICILQQAEEPVWNITMVLMTLNMLNLKISAISGDVLNTEIRNIMDLRANTKKE